MEANDNNINKLISCVEIFKRNDENFSMQQENKVFSRQKEEKKEGEKNVSNEMEEKKEAIFREKQFLVNNLLIILK